MWNKGEIMPTYKKGNMWDCLNEVDHFIITTNAIVKRNGALVMGAGIAKQARDAYPDLDVMFGSAVNLFSKDGYYGCLLWANNKWGIFQVKHHFKDEASLELITKSTQGLRNHAEQSPDQTYALNFPGIGNGKLNYDAVKPIVSTLPDNVQVWTFA